MGSSCGGRGRVLHFLPVATPFPHHLWAAVAGTRPAAGSLGRPAVSFSSPAYPVRAGDMAGHTMPSFSQTFTTTTLPPPLFPAHTLPLYLHHLHPTHHHYTPHLPSSSPHPLPHTFLHLLHLPFCLHTTPRSFTFLLPHHTAHTRPTPPRTHTTRTALPHHLFSHFSPLFYAASPLPPFTPHTTTHHHTTYTPSPPPPSPSPPPPCPLWKVVYSLW